MNSSMFGGFHGIIFDAYGTLFDVTAISIAVGDICDDADRISQLWRTKQLEYSVLRTVMDRYADFGDITSDALDYTMSFFGISLAPGERRRLMGAWLELPAYDDVVDAFDHLHAAGQRLIILTNGTRQMIEPLVERAGLRRHMFALMTSEDVQSFKPDLSIYHLITERIHARMNEILFVTANGFDVAGAKAAGLTVCRVNRNNLPLDPLGFEPDMVVGDLTEMVDRLVADHGDFA